MNREWVLPIVLGVLTAIGLGLLPQPRHAPAPVTNDPIAFPFRDSFGPLEANTTFIVLAPHGKSAFLARLNETGDSGQASALEWKGQTLALYTEPNLYAGCYHQVCSDPTWVFGSYPLPRARGLHDEEMGHRLGIDGYNATRVTAYVFDSTGALFATNADDAAAFAGGADARRLPGGAWYLGDNATAPDGTQAVPPLAGALMAKMLPLLHGLPVGGVASMQTNAAVVLYGTLFVTVRIDALVQAP